MVSVLPDGKLFGAISHYAHHKASHGAFDDAVLTIFESIVHPLSSLLPDRKNLMGRLVGVFEAFKIKMTPVQRRTFDDIWAGDITGGIVGINAKYIKLHDNFSSSKKNKTTPSLVKFLHDVDEIKELYKRYTNKFMDMASRSRFHDTKHGRFKWYGYVSGVASRPSDRKIHESPRAPQSVPCGKSKLGFVSLLTVA